MNKMYLHYTGAGFSLVELMFVIAIIGILSSIAFPAYQNYASKTQIHVAFQAISTLKSPIEIKLNNSENISNVADLGWPTGGIRMIRNDPTVLIDPSTATVTLEATLDGEVYPHVRGIILKLIRSNNGIWSCKLQRSNVPGWNDSYAPKTCDII